MQSNVTVSFLSALCISSFSSAGSKRRSGPRHPDNEKMRGTEAMKGNIPSNMPHFSLFGPLSLCSVPHPTSQLVFPGCTPSGALCGEQEAGLEACCLQAKVSGYETSAWKKVATFPTMNQSQTDSHVQETRGKVQGRKSLSTTEFRHENQPLADEQKKTCGAHWNFQIRNTGFPWNNA